MNHEHLVEVFVDALSATLRDEARSVRDLGEVLGNLLETGRALTPDVHVDDEVFLRHLAARVSGSESLSAVLAATRGPDLFLACAATHGDARAIAAIDAQLRARVPNALQRLRLGSEAIDDVMQLVRMKVLVGDATRPPKIAEYAGRGPLQGWLRVVAVRTALDGLRVASPGHGEDEAMVDVMTGADDPETRLLRRRHMNEFKIAFAEAVRALPSKERVMLRLHFVDGLSIDEVGTVYHVHRATAARWIATSRALLLREIRDRLGARLRATTSELDSIMRGVRSQLDVSLCGFLTTDE